MISIILALISFFGWGIGDIFGTISARKIGAHSTTYWNLVLGLLASSIYIPFALNDIQHFNLQVIVTSLILGIVFVIGFIAFNEGLRIANPALVGTIAASFAMLTVIFSVIFFKEKITALQIFCIVMIFFGLLLSSINIKDLQKLKRKFNKGILLAFVAMLCWGAYYTFIRIPVDQVGWFWPQYITFSLFPLLFIYIKFTHKRLRSWSKNRVFLPLFMNAILLAIGEFSFNFAISKGSSAIVASIVGAYPVLFAVIAFFVFKDPISKQQIAGIVISLLGIVFLSGSSY